MNASMDAMTGTGGAFFKARMPEARFGPGVAMYVVDAFTREPFRGNPAAVCPLERFPADETLHRIAAENNLSETAFVVPRASGAEGHFDLRWLTPRAEVDLCGHGTLASAHVLYTFLPFAADALRFHTRSGVLSVARVGGGAYVMDFPRYRLEPHPAHGAVVDAVGRAPVEAFRAGGSVLLVYATSEDVGALAPDMARLRALDGVRSVMATARGTGPNADVDFVSRYFAPKDGIDEDPVTGAAHCALTPLWAERLGKARLFARQISTRAGELHCELAGDRVLVEGYAVLVKSGVMHVRV